MKRFALIILILSGSGILFISCPGGKHAGVNNENVNLSDSMRFISIPDAQAIDPSWSKENTFIYQVIALPDQLHPTNGTTAMRSEINMYTQVFLVGTDFRTLSLRPMLVKSLPEVSPDQLKYVYELREEPRWDDGSPITVEDVLFTCKANKCPLTENPHVKPYWENITQVIQDSANLAKFTVVMRKPYLQNIAFWGDFPIMQRKLYDPNNYLHDFSLEQFGDSSFKADKNELLVKWATEFNNPRYGIDVAFIKGAGPYQVTTWEPDQFITITRKKDHWTKNSKDYLEASLPEKIIFKLNRDPNSQLVEFKSQTYDGSTYLSAKILNDLQQDSLFNKNYNSRFASSFNYSYIAMNLRPDGSSHKKLFTDKNVRKAMAMLTPVDQINQVVNKGRYKRQLGPVSSLKADFNTSEKPVPLDIEGAKRILNEAGWKDTDNDGILDKVLDGEKIPFSFNINFYSTVVDWKDMATMIAEEMMKVGVKANLNPLDVPVFLQAARSHDFDMLIGVWSSGALPDDFTQIWHTESWVSQGSNYAGFGNTASDALIDSIKYTMDDTTRNEMSKRFQQIVTDEQPYIFLFESARRIVAHKRFGNCEMYFERPGLLLSNFRLLSAKDESSQ